MKENNNIKNNNKSSIKMKRISKPTRRKAMEAVIIMIKTIKRMMVTTWTRYE